jgi:hypothetical protein
LRLKDRAKEPRLFGPDQYNPFYAFASLVNQKGSDKWGLKLLRIYVTMVRRGPTPANPGYFALTRLCMTGRPALLCHCQTLGIQVCPLRRALAHSTYRRNEECLNRALPPAIFLFPAQSLWFDETAAEDLKQVPWRGHAEEVHKAKNFTMFVYRVMQKECGMSVADAESWCKNHLSKRTRYFFSEHHITPLPLENLPDFIKTTDLAGPRAHCIGHSLPTSIA